MKPQPSVLLAPLLRLVLVATAYAGKRLGPYRLPGVDLRQRVIWGAVCEEPEGKGLAFGGEDQQAEDGRPHTRIKLNGRWVHIEAELRAKNKLQKFHDRVGQIRTDLKNTLARARYIFFRGLKLDREKNPTRENALPRLEKILTELKGLLEELRSLGGLDEYENVQVSYVTQRIESVPVRLGNVKTALEDGLHSEELNSLLSAQIELEKACDALDAEPPPRSLTQIVYDRKTKLYVMYGGDHLDYLMNDTWVFDPEKRRWEQRRPPSAPSPRAQYPPKASPNAKVRWGRRAWPEKPFLKANGDGTITLSGGYTYFPNTNYLGGQYTDVADREWKYDVVKDVWT